MQLNVSKSMGAAPPESTVKVFNLNPSTSQQIEKRGQDAVLLAGYGENLSTVFKGRLDSIQDSRSGLDRVLELTFTGVTAAEVESSSTDTLAGKTVVRSYPNQTRPTIHSVLRDIITSPPVGLKIGSLEEVPDRTLPGTYIDGSVKDFITNLLRSTSVDELDWFEDDGVIKFNRGPRGPWQPDVVPVTLTPETGLIGIPKRTEEDGVNADSFMRPEATVGCRVDIRSKTLSGTWKAIAVKHVGDNWQGPFKTSFTLKPVSGSSALPDSEIVPEES